MNTTSLKPVKSVADCKKCKAPHYTHQLTCKRCGEYLNKEDVLGGTDTHTLAIAGGILAVSTAVLVVCLALHMF